MPKQSTSFWTFSNQLYDKDDVASACLYLQNEFQFDVNLLLFCCWAGHFDNDLSGESWKQILDFSKRWKSGVVQPLRDTRNWMKNNAHRITEENGFPTLREKIKLNELAAEKFQQEYIEKCAKELKMKNMRFSPVRAENYIDKLMKANHVKTNKEISAQLRVIIQGVDKC